MNREPGIYSGISNTDYHADKTSYSSSLIKLMGIPARAKHAIDNPSAYKDCYRIGSAIHKYILEPDEFKAEFLTGIDTPRRSKANKTEWAEWFNLNGAKGNEIVDNPAADWNMLFEQQTGKHMVTPDEIEAIRLMSESVFANDEARQLLEKGAAEQSIYWQDEETGLSLRCRPDYLNDFCSDLKSCQSAAPHAVSREIFSRGYHISQAMYQSGVHAVTKIWPPFLFIFVEKTPPCLCAVYALDEESQQLAYETYRAYLTKLQYCLESNQWEGLDNNLDLSLPNYAFIGE